MWIGKFLPGALVRVFRSLAGKTGLNPDRPSPLMDRASKRRVRDAICQSWTLPKWMCRMVKRLLMCCQFHMLEGDSRLQKDSVANLCSCYTKSVTAADPVDVQKPAAIRTLGLGALHRSRPCGSCSLAVGCSTHDF